jgi:hypothetical protein
MKMQLATVHRKRARALFRRSLATPKAPGRVFRMVDPVPSRSALGQRIIDVARREAPTDSERQRVLDGVLAALRQLTSGAA